MYRGRLENLVVLGVFGLGCLVGLAALARILSYLLKRFRDPTMAALGGLMLGSLRKLWPWRETVRWTEIRNKRVALEEANRIPQVFDGEVALVIGLTLVGLVLVIVLERLAGEGEVESPKTGSKTAG